MPARQGGRDQFFVGGLGSVFLVPANNTFGNMPRNWLFGPKFINQDMSLAKRFTITERSQVELRAEAFNAFNHTNLGDPNSNVPIPTPVRLRDLRPGYQMRRLQFALRLDF